MVAFNDGGSDALGNGMSLDILERTCISGRICVIDAVNQHLDIEGVDSPTAHLMVLDTCGVAPLSPNLGHQNWLASSLNSSRFENVLTAFGGQYRLCWCFVSENLPTWPCDMAEHFRHDLGRLHLVGPSPEEFTCFSGENCEIFLKVTEVKSPSPTVNVLAIMDTCGDNSYKMVSQLNQMSESAIFLSVTSTLMLSGGQYRLCWCHLKNLKNVNSRSVGELLTFSRLSALGTGVDFVDFGSLQVLGPMMRQDRTCVSGFTCMLDGLEGTLNGEILVLDTCGVGTVIDRFASAGLARISNLDGIQVIWDTITAAGGVYRLCWKAGPLSLNANASEDGVPADFRMDLGSLTLIGATLLDQDRTCVSGHTCELDGLRGYFSQGDVFMVLATCSLGLTGSMDSMLGMVGIPSTPPSFPASVSVMLSPMSSSRQTFRLCWSRTSRDEVDVNVAGEAVDIGGFTLIGPSTLSSTCIAGEACILDGLVGHLSISDQFLIADTCGEAGAIHQFPGFGFADSVRQSGSQVYWGFVSASGGVYRLCWCASACTRYEDFVVDTGTLDIIGPVHGQTGTCVSGHTCLIEAQGHHLRHDFADRVLILDTCVHLVQPPRIAASWNGLVRDSNPVLTILTMTAAGGEYRLCWCNAEVCDSTSFYNPYNVLIDFGQLHVLGPNPLSQDRTCISGQSCVLKEIGITGLESLGATQSQVSQVSQVLVMETCGVATTLPRFPTSAPLASNEWATSFEIAWEPISAAAGNYRLCWCYSVDSDCEKLLWSHVDIGLLTLIGPTFLTQDQTCVSGQLCRLDWREHGNNGSVLIMDTCGTNALANFATLLNFPRGNVLNSTIVASGGNFRLCWCGGTFCSSSTDFLTDIGVFHLVGPQRITQTCVTGQTCNLHDFGIARDTYDTLALLDTCGVDFPSFAQFDDEFKEIAQGSMAAGTYQLCWCSKHFPCVTADAFNVPVGQMLLLGLSPRQSRPCISGRPCRLLPLEGTYSDSQILSVDFM